MHTEGVKRLIFIGSMGIYGEVLGEHYRSVFDPHRDSAALIEQFDLDYTILRPGWFTHDEAIDYQTTQKGEPFRGHDVSLNSLSDLIAKLVTSPGLYVRCSLGVSAMEARHVVVMPTIRLAQTRCPTAEILRTLRAYHTAMVDARTADLDALLAPDFALVRMTGYVQPKAEWFDVLRSRQFDCQPDRDRREDGLGKHQRCRCL